jgi:hypothetical protein
MLRTMLLSFGIALFVAGCLLSVLGLATHGINNGEWRTISQTGLPSRPELFTWSAWRPNNRSVYPFRSFQPFQQPETLPEYRVGRGKGCFFDFVFYQGRFARDGVSHEFPAIGPGWGAAYHWDWALLAFAGGAVCCLASHLRARHASDSHSDDSPHATNVTEQ